MIKLEHLDMNWSLWGGKEFIRRPVGGSDVSWRKVLWVDETTIDLFDHQSRTQATLCVSAGKIYLIHPQ